MSRGLGKNQLLILEIMSNEHPIYEELGYAYRQSDLVEITGISKASVSRSLKRLFDAGYFQRTKETFIKREQDVHGSYHYEYVLITHLDLHNELMAEQARERAEEQLKREAEAARYGMDYMDYAWAKVFGTLPPLPSLHGDFSDALSSMVCTMCKAALAYLDANLSTGDKCKVLRTARSMAHPDKGACSKDSATLGQYIESLA